MLLEAIMHSDMPDTSALTYEVEDESFVDISVFSEGKILVDMQYFIQGRDGAISTAYLRRGAAERLVKAALLLPEGYRLKVYDAWRPYEVQKSLFDEYADSLAALPENRDKSYGEICDMARVFVSFPDREKRFSFVHSSGGAVDLTVVGPDGAELDMGCGFDDFTPVANTDALEGTEQTDRRDNRRLLYSVMTEVGFTNFPSEWWHYDFGDIFWAAMTDRPVRYPSVYSLD